MSYNVRYLVRHGRSQENVSPKAKEAFRSGQRSNPQLTPLGRKQINRAGEFLAADLQDRDIRKVLIVKSPIDRAVDSGLGIARAIPDNIAVQVLRLDGLREVEFMPRGTPVTEEHRLFDRQLATLTHKQLVDRLSRVTRESERAAARFGADAIIYVGHQSGLRFWAAQELLGLPLAKADGFPKMGNAAIWDFAANKLSERYPESRVLAQRNAPPVWTLRIPALAAQGHRGAAMGAPV
jgi:broad specificity phosphatase PhoE